MSWNYRIVKCAISPDQQGAGEKFFYLLCEVYYDGHGAPYARSLLGAAFQATEPDGPEAIAEALKLALRDATERPVLNEWEIRGLEHLAPDAA